MGDLKYMATLYYVLLYFDFLHQISHFIFTHFSSSVLHTFTAFTPYGYDIILSKICDLLSSLLLSAILLISLVYTLCDSLLILCCDSDMVSLFSK